MGDVSFDDDVYIVPPPTFSIMLFRKLPEDYDNLTAIHFFQTINGFLEKIRMIRLISVHQNDNPQFFCSHRNAGIGERLIREFFRRIYFFDGDLHVNLHQSRGGDDVLAMANRMNKMYDAPPIRELMWIAENEYDNTIGITNRPVTHHNVIHPLEEEYSIDVKVIKPGDDDTMETDIGSWVEDDDDEVFELVTCAPVRKN